MTGLNPIAAPYAKQASVAYADYGVSGSTTNSYTFSSKSIGAVAAPNETRRIIVAVFGLTAAASDVDVTAVTVGGISATRAVELEYQSGNKELSIWYVDVPTGTSAAVVVTWDNNCQMCGVYIFRAIDAGDVADTVTDSKTSGTTCSGALDVPADGIVVAVAENANSRTHAWTNVTEGGFDGAVSSTDYFSGGSQAYAADQTGLTITCTFSGAITVAGMAAVSFRAAED